MNEKIRLEELQLPQDLKKLSLTQCSTLCKEIRSILISTVSKTGGHLASNLGAVELTMALHRNFNSPDDKIVWDVGHQSYTHKILTGRLDKFSTLRQENGISGFPKPEESPHDTFISGHSSTSVSVACGIAEAMKLQGRTTDCLLCEPDDNNILKIIEVGTSLDLKAGQAVDRTGLMLGLCFPCGSELEKLAINADKNFKVKPVLRDGSCCLSGVENKCSSMLKNGEKHENIAKFCLDFIAETIIAMTAHAINKYSELPLVFAGGVMSDYIIRDKIISHFPQACFAEPQFSCDNAAGVAIYGYLKSAGDKLCL